MSRKFANCFGIEVQINNVTYDMSTFATKQEFGSAVWFDSFGEYEQRGFGDAAEKANADERIAHEQWESH